MMERKQQNRPRFDTNGWRRLADGRIQHISGIEFMRVPDGDVQILKDSLPVFIQNLKKEGVEVEMAEKLLLKLSVQVKELFFGLH